MEALKNDEAKPAFIESMTRVQYGHWTVRVWKQEFLVEDKYDTEGIKKFVRKGVWQSKKHLATEVLKLDLVEAVEVVGKNGNGLVLYKNWP